MPTRATITTYPNGQRTATIISTPNATGNNARPSTGKPTNTDGSRRTKKRIERFRTGSPRTPLFASVMNEIVDCVNRANNIVGKNGISVDYSDSNIVISYKPTVDKDGNILGETNTNVTGSGGGGDTYICNCRYG